ncbi:MAG: helix-turn-helix transcriptional regulator [Bacteroidota bacterium]
MNEIFQIKSISQFHELLGLPSPEHPLISLINEEGNQEKPELDENLRDIKFYAEMYAIMYKDKINGSLGYGRSSYDFQEGTLIFSSPGQVFSTAGQENYKDNTGWTLLFHPDLLQKSNLLKKMDSYSYFSYDVNEALHLSEKEERFISDLVQKIREEYSQNLDRHSQRLIISNLELLLNYCDRFFDRQFYTRSNLNKNVVTQFESLLKDYFQSNKINELGLPSVNYFGEKLQLSTNYLTDLLKKETGRSIKEHIDRRIVENAKYILLNSNQSIGEIAYSLGFEYPQSFSRLFKNKTGMSPLEYRKGN